MNIPTQLWRLVKKSLQHYLQAKPSVQRNVNRSIWIRGRYGKEYVFQTSHGTQQIKRYEPKKYKNNVNTPLRIRTRTIMKMAMESPSPSIKEKIRELYKTYPFYLLKSEPVNLRLKNFYFEKRVREKDLVSIYRAESENCNGEEDKTAYWEGKYQAKKTVRFEWQGDDQECWYAVNQRNGERSNVLKFVWKDVAIR